WRVQIGEFVRARCPPLLRGTVVPPHPPWAVGQSTELRKVETGSKQRLPFQLSWSGRWELNPRPSAWEADALPLSYARSPDQDYTTPTAPSPTASFARHTHVFAVRFAGVEGTASQLLHTFLA